MLKHTPDREWWQDRYRLVLYVIRYGGDEIVLRIMCIVSVNSCGPIFLSLSKISNT